MRQQHTGGAIISIVTDTVKQFGIAYDIHLWLRGLTWLTIAGAAYLLVRISGGFPPLFGTSCYRPLPRVRTFSLCLELQSCFLCWRLSPRYLPCSPFRG